MAGASVYPTARLLIQDALTELGVVSPGEDLKSEDAAFALRTLNRMLEGWNTEGMMVFSLNLLKFNTVGNKQEYTLGVGGDVNVDRPVSIQMASIVLQYAPYKIEEPLNILTDEEWQNVAVKQTPSNFPVSLWIEGNFPLNRLWFWPVPTDVNEVVLYTWNKNSAMTLDSVVSLPNGYEDAIVSNLALMLCTSYGLQPSQALAVRSNIAKRRLESFNSQPIYIGSESCLLGRQANSNAIKTFGRLID